MAEADKDGPTVMQPGQVISPGGSTATAPPPPVTPAAAPVVAAPAPPKPVVSPEPAPTPPPVAELPAAPQEPIDTQLSGDDDGISWTASEFVAHEKSAAWYTSLAAVTVLFSALIFLLTHDAVSVVVVVVAALLMGVYGARKPRQLVYQLTDVGIGIGEKHFPYEMFRSFSIVPEGAFSSIVLMPLKRFSPLITIYFAPDDEDIIADVLSERLPYAEFRYDAVDRLMRRIRF